MYFNLQKKYYSLEKVKDIPLIYDENNILFLRIKDENFFLKINKIFSFKETSNNKVPIFVNFEDNKVKEEFLIIPFSYENFISFLFNLEYFLNFGKINNHHVIELDNKENFILLEKDKDKSYYIGFSFDKVKNLFSIFIKEEKNNYIFSIQYPIEIYKIVELYKKLEKIFEKYIIKKWKI